MAGNYFDKACRYAAAVDPVGLFAWLLGINAARFRFAGWLDTRNVPFPGGADRFGDIVARLEEPDGGSVPWAVPLEFQLKPDPAMFGRLMVYLGELWLRERPDPERGSRYEVGAVVVNLTGRGSAGREMRWPGTGLMTCLGPVDVNLAGHDAGPTLDKIERGELARCVLPWVPLMRAGDAVDIIDKWKELAAGEPDAKRRSDFASLARVLADAADRRELWTEHLKGWDVRESQLVLEWINEATAEVRAEAIAAGRAEGLATGRAEGLATGRAEGLATGRAEGRAEGLATGRADALLAVMGQRFGELPEELRDSIRATTDVAALDRWVVLSVSADSLERFREESGL